MMRLLGMLFLGIILFYVGTENFALTGAVLLIIISFHEIIMEAKEEIFERMIRGEDYVVHKTKKP